MHNVEVGIGSAVKLEFVPGETVEVAQELMSGLLSSGFFETVDDVIGTVEGISEETVEDFTEDSAGAPEDTVNE